MVHARLGKYRAVAIAADKGVVEIGAPGGMPQRHQQIERAAAQIVRQHVGQATGFDKAEVSFGVFLLTGPGQGVGAVIELARILQGIPVAHHDLADAGVVECLIRVPGRPVVQVFHRLDVVAAFLIARGRFVSETTGQMIKRLAQGLDADRAKIDVHVYLPPTLHPG
ncbi:hypothetical protein D3C78_1278590 [compost metagenome]